MSVPRYGTFLLADLTYPTTTTKASKKYCGVHDSPRLAVFQAAPAADDETAAMLENKVPPCTESRGDFGDTTT